MAEVESKIKITIVILMIRAIPPNLFRQKYNRVKEQIRNAIGMAELHADQPLINRGNPTGINQYTKSEEILPRNVSSDQGNSAEYLTRRLARDRPDIVDRMKAGEFASVRAAAIDPRPHEATPRPDPPIPHALRKPLQAPNSRPTSKHTPHAHNRLEPPLFWPTKAITRTAGESWHRIRHHAITHKSQFTICQ